MHLFAGLGGGLLADRILGHEPIIAVEWDKYCCQVLRERAAEGWFPNLQVWQGDVRLFDPSEYAGQVDCIHAGFPCQDISVAGKQAGVGTETRSGLYREVLRIARVVRPQYLFLENVAAIVNNGLGTVLADITALGYDSEWLCLRASDCGAKHHRDRWWLLANARHSGICERREPSDAVQNVRLTSTIFRNDLSSREKEESEILADSAIIGQSGSGQPFIRRSSASEAEGQANRAQSERIGNQWATEPNVGRVANGIPNRIQRLKGLGNAQVPIQAAVAFQLLKTSFCELQ